MGLGVFKSALERTDLLKTLDETPNLTLLVPQNSALENSSCWWSDVKLTAAIKEHVLVDFPGYTPLLKNNTSYQTLAGTSLTVVIADDGKISFGDAEILSGGSDVIIKNGVLHAVSGVSLFPSFFPLRSVGFIAVAAISHPIHLSHSRPSRT